MAPRNRLCLRFIGGLLLFVATITLGRADTGTDLEHNRQLLEKWRADADHAQRLQRDLQAFHALPPQRQQAIRQLDRQLHEGNLATQMRRWAVIERYASWLEKLPPEERQRVENAPDAASRLEIVRELRLREWLERLPVRQRVEVLRLPVEQQGPRVLQLRDAERRQRQEWVRLATGRTEGAVPRPARLADLPAEVRSFVEVVLIPRLTPEERDRLLRRAEGKYPDLLRAIRELSETHPVLPPLPSGPVMYLKDLPPGTRRQVRMDSDAIRRTQGRWPVFALEVNRHLRSKNVECPPLGASRLEEFPAEVQEAVRKLLLPQLSESQMQVLKEAEGQWPEYPQALLKLARNKRVVLPIMSLPGPAAMWDVVRPAAGS